MSNSTKEIIDNIFDELVALQESIKKDAADTSNAYNVAAPQKVELLTIKECADMIDGLSEHTVRQMVKQGKVKSIRTGVGKNGKILINKADFMDYRIWDKVYLMITKTKEKSTFIFSEVHIL